MLFFVFTFITGLLCMIGPFVLLRFIVRKWHLENKIFWRSGLAGIVIATVVLGVIMNIQPTFPGFAGLPDILQALVLGAVSGLFVELGKFIVLDKLLPSVRHREQVVLFGIGWSFIGMMLMGALLTFGSFGMYNLSTTKDLTSLLPDADPEQIQFLQEGQQQLQILMNGSPLKAFTPLLESVSIIAVDVAMSFIIVFGLRRRQTRYVWMATGVRTLIAGSFFFLAQTKIVPIELIYIGWVIAGAVLFRVLYRALPPVARP